MTVDLLFFLAIGAIGWGLSLATYGPVARRYAWPRGSLHAERPAVPVLLGVASLLAGLLYVGQRVDPMQGSIAVVCGVCLAVFWTGFLRVGSQASLVLAPAAAVLLILAWIGSIGG